MLLLANSPIRYAGFVTVATTAISISA
jgi:hypothetical protein